VRKDFPNPNDDKLNPVRDTEATGEKESIDKGHYAWYYQFEELCFRRFW